MLCQGEHLRVNAVLQAYICKDSLMKPRTTRQFDLVKMNVDSKLIGSNIQPRVYQWHFKIMTPVVLVSEC